MVVATGGNEELENVRDRIQSYFMSIRVSSFTLSLSLSLSLCRFFDLFVTGLLTLFGLGQ